MNSLGIDLTNKSFIDILKELWNYSLYGQYAVISIVSIGISGTLVYLYFTKIRPIQLEHKFNRLKKAHQRLKKKYKFVMQQNDQLARFRDLVHASYANKPDHPDKAVLDIFKDI